MFLYSETKIPTNEQTFIDSRFLGAAIVQISFNFWLRNMQKRDISVQGKGKEDV